MAKNIVPYAFTPGTKAKAEEVNANFNALASAIDENHTALTSRIDEMEVGVSEDISSATADFMKNDLSDFPGLTNCIIKAPNGIISYETNVITAKAGLTVLVPAGKNENGLPKSSVFTLENNISRTFDSAMSRKYLFLCANSTLETASQYIESETQPATADTVWLNTAENLMYKSNANSEYIQTDMVLIGDNLISTASAITSVNTFKPLEMLFETDKERILSWNTFDYNAGITIGTPYTAPCPGRFIYIYLGNPGAGGIYVNGRELWYTAPPGNSSCMDRTGFVDVDKGEQISYASPGANSRKVFYPAKGGNF
ncbi:hypothetical protein J6E39_04680 [bacterium]|nr:hypothetical protein [bacterium]